MSVMAEIHAELFDLVDRRYDGTGKSWEKLYEMMTGGDDSAAGKYVKSIADGIDEDEADNPEDWQEVVMEILRVELGVEWTFVE